MRTWLALLFAISAPIGIAEAGPADPLTPYRAAREAFIENFRVSGARDPAPLVQHLPELQSIAARTSGELRARALLEIAEIQRLSNAASEAVPSYTRAADAAARLGGSDIAFDAWMGLARTHNLFTKDHGAAAAAMERAIAAAGANPTPKQRFDIARYLEELADARGESELALVGALDAARLAPTPNDRFYAELGTGTALSHIGESCDYRQLRDSRTINDPGDDGWGACRRAVTAAEAAYARAARTADSLGWKNLASQARSSAYLGIRRKLIEYYAHGIPDSSGLSDPDFVKFTPRNRKDVLVHSGEFARRDLLASTTGLSAPADLAQRHLLTSMTGLSTRADLAKLTEQTIAFSESATGKDDPGTLQLRANLEDMRAGKPAAATELLAEGADLLAVQRASFFDPRRRGTVIESEGTLLRDLALRLLAQKRDADAFAVFESARARGLGELAQLLAGDEVTAEDRAWLAELVRLEAETSAEEMRIVEDVIGEGGLDRPADELSRWEKIQDNRLSYLRGRPDTRDRLTHASYSPSSLAELQRAASSSGIPILLYWVDKTNVYGWYLGPHGSDFRIIFLPEAALKTKIARLKAASDEQGKFDESAARELYLYLIAPFEDVLDAKQVIIVPQGEIVDLPFELLIEPDTGKFLVERWVVSYAPNASMASGALTRPVPSIKRVTAIVDNEIDDGTHEMNAIRLANLQLDEVNSYDVMPDKLGQSLRGTESAHLLLHGAFKAEPLLSTLAETSGEAAPLSAAGLLALPLSGLKLVVLSACESGEVQHRISNEIYGFPWVLIADGAENVLTSRWRVNGASNGRWMQSFYAAIADGASPAEAAAAAMRAMLKEDGSKPYFWAAMQVIGR